MEHSDYGDEDSVDSTANDAEISENEQRSVERDSDEESVVSEENEGKQAEEAADKSSSGSDNEAEENENDNENDNENNENNENNETKSDNEGDEDAEQSVARDDEGESNESENEEENVEEVEKVDDRSDDDEKNESREDEVAESSASEDENDKMSVADDDEEKKNESSSEGEKSDVEDDRQENEAKDDDRNSGAEESDVEEDRREKADESDVENDGKSEVEVEEKGEIEEKGSDKEGESEEEEEEEEEGKEKVQQLVEDIFGDSGDEEEFDGFADDEVVKAKKKKELSVIQSGSEDEGGKETAEGTEEPVAEDVLPALSDDEDDPQKLKKMDHRRDYDSEEESFVSDFDVMLTKRKEEQRYRQRKRKDVDIINDNDDLIADMIHQMKYAAEEDRELNKAKQAATKKLKLLPAVITQLRKHDLKIAFLDQGILSILTDWLAPLPDRSLSHLQIRDNILKVLQEYPPLDQSLLKSSGIGKAVMYLYKHPKETKENRERAGRLVSEWARPIFNLSSNFRSMSKEEREQRDFEHMPKKRKLSLEEGTHHRTDLDGAISEQGKPQKRADKGAMRPGEPGWVPRARVPTPSTKDYVVRPKWNVETEFIRGANKKQMTRLDKHVRAFSEKKRMNKVQRAVKISIEGRKMAL